MKKIKNGIKNNVIYISLIVFIIQGFLTYLFTNTKRFSLQAYIMNIAVVYSIYLFYITRKSKVFIIPIVIRAVFFIINITYGNLQKYLTTDYLYSDFFENLINNNKCLQYYTEGDFIGLFPFTTTNVTSEEEFKIIDSCSKIYYNALKNGKSDIFNLSLQEKAQDNKFKWIVEKLGITSQSKVLELGFGKIDLMKYIRDNTGATVEGTNLSLKQIKKAEENGFKCYNIEHRDISKNFDVLDKYDVIITNGTIEYLDNMGDDTKKIYTDFSDSIYELLNPGGKWYTTTIHINDNILERKTDNWSGVRDLLPYYLKNDNSFMNLYNVYMLALGNEGAYPIGKDGLTKWFSKDKFNVIFQEDRTIDYLLSSFNWLICQISKYNNTTLVEKLHSSLKHLICYLVTPSYLESYICYIYTNNHLYQPWLWQFIRQPNGYRPVTHYWIITQKK